ncbi:MAG TPA: hypothetical protein VHD35_09310 [Chitinophagaceae bacterium]|jgi:hypothetical protein|nr:hypothetical protein [Chitinophagaceae bacterium]
MKSALIKLSQKLIINRESTQMPFKKIFRETHRSLVADLEDNAYSNWQQAKQWRNEEVALNGLMAEIINKIIPQFHLAQFELDERLFRSQPFLIKAEIIDINILDESSYNLAIYLLTDVLTLIDKTGDNMLLAVGDKSEELKEGKELDVFAIVQNEVYSINKYTIIN